ncbi:MAG: hypothetical protein WB610_16370 [Rhodomicrobium sp.]|jgi:hypothetical protein
MDMIGHQMAFLYPAFPPPGQAVKYLLDFSEDRFLTALRYDICNPMWHGSGDAAAGSPYGISGFPLEILLSNSR